MFKQQKKVFWPLPGFNLLEKRKYNFELEANIYLICVIIPFPDIKDWFIKKRRENRLPDPLATSPDWKVPIPIP